MVTRTGRDEGFGMVEVLIAMFIVALIALAFLPLLVQGLSAAALNTKAAAAAQLVNEKITAVAGTPWTCADAANPDSPLHPFVTGQDDTFVEETGSGPLLNDRTPVTIEYRNLSSDPSELCTGGVAAGTMTLRVSVRGIHQDAERVFAGATTIVQLVPVP
ncbi:type IV pilus modification PilV family protein [Microbacterium album]|nr:prepilin-type N-terminal cleavage/methylation domain-containing protein [Microbacterium album]